MKPMKEDYITDLLDFIGLEYEISKGYYDWSYLRVFKVDDQGLPYYLCRMKLHKGVLYNLQWYFTNLSTDHENNIWAVRWVVAKDYIQYLTEEDFDSIITLVNQKAEYKYQLKLEDRKLLEDSNKRKLSEHELAWKVKVCDTYSNLTESIKDGSVKRVRKYSTQLDTLYKFKNYGE